MRRTTRVPNRSRRRAKDGRKDRQLAKVARWLLVISVAFHSASIWISFKIDSLQHTYAADREEEEYFIVNEASLKLVQRDYMDLQVQLNTLKLLSRLSSNVITIEERHALVSTGRVLDSAIASKLLMATRVAFAMGSDDLPGRELDTMFSSLSEEALHDAQGVLWDRAKVRLDLVKSRMLSVRDALSFWKTLQIIVLGSSTLLVVVANLLLIGRDPANVTAAGFG